MKYEFKYWWCLKHPLISPLKLRSTLSLTARKPVSRQRSQHTGPRNWPRYTLRVIFNAFLFVTVVFLILISARGKKPLSATTSKVSYFKTPPHTPFKSPLPTSEHACPALLHRNPHCWWLPFLWHSNSQQPGDFSNCFSFVSTFCLFSRCWEACTLKMLHKCLLNGGLRTYGSLKHLPPDSGNLYPRMHLWSLKPTAVQRANNEVSSKDRDRVARSWNCISSRPWFETLGQPVSHPQSGITG